MRHSKKLMRLLLLLVLGIWGAIAYRIYASIVAGDSSGTSLHVPSEPDKNRPVEPYVYAKDVRDPFRYVLPRRRDTSKLHAVTEPPVVWTPPPFRLTGILVAQKNKTVMLEGSNGSAFFLHEGDTLSGVRILKIKDKTVSYAYQKKKMEWVLEGP